MYDFKPCPKCADTSVKRLCDSCHHNRQELMFARDLNVRYEVTRAKLLSLERDYKRLLEELANQ